MNSLEKYPEIKNTLLKIALVLNENKINWALGGSLLLYLYGINTTVNDIDIVIDTTDISKVEKFINQFSHIEKDKTEIYLTERFYSIRINKVIIDLMIGFKISSDKGVYIYPDADKLINRTINMDDITINLCSLKDWLNAYKAIGRDNKVKLIEQSKLVK